MDRRFTSLAGVLTCATIMAFLSPTAATAQPAVFINEVHYDNTGTNAGEAIEIAGPAGTDLTADILERTERPVGEGRFRLAEALVRAFFVRLNVLWTRSIRADGAAALAGEAGILFGSTSCHFRERSTRPRNPA